MADSLSIDIEIRFSTDVRIAACLDMPPSAVTVLFGPSGSGKTSVVRAIAGLLTPSSGVIRFGEHTWFDSGKGGAWPPQRRRVGYVSQDPSLFPHLTVIENVEYGLGRLDRLERTPRATEAIELLGLGGLERRYPRQLSGGQAQRVALARAIAPRPSLLLLDEPLAALDAPARAQMRRDLRAALTTIGASCLLVTHDRVEAIELADWMAVLAEGRIRQMGPVLDVFRRPADLVVARSVGVESVIAGRIDRIAGGLAEVRVGEAVIRTVEPDETADGRDVFVCIRAEDVTLERGVSKGGSARNHFTGVVESIETEGSLERVTLDCGFPLVALVTRSAREELALVPGAPIAAAVKAAAVHLIPRAGRAE